MSFMRCRLFDRRFLLFSVLSGFLLTGAGCQSGDTATALDPNGGTEPAEQKVSETDLRAYCPPVTLRDGTAYFNTYVKGATDDATKVIYQASIADVTRTCTTADGAMAMQIAVAGRIVPGPAFSAGTITMPIRIAVTRGEEVLYSEIHRYEVNVSDPTAATQFVFKDANISLAGPIGRGVRAFAGYDEGPPAKKP